MEIYDVIMLVVIAAATIFGAFKGLAWQVASLASIFVSYYLACRFRAPVAEMISAAEPWNTFLAMLLIYVASSLLIWMAFRFVAEMIDRIKLKEFDRQIGALVGLAKGVLLCVIITLFGVTLLGEQQRQTIVHSRSGYYIARLLDNAHGVMPSEVHKVLHPYIHKLDPEHGKGHDDEHDGAHPEDGQRDGARGDGSSDRINQFLDRIGSRAEERKR